MKRRRRYQLPEVPARHPEFFREITVGTSVPSHRVTPRIVGAENVARFKNLMGVCLEPGCHKIAGHDGRCSVDANTTVGKSLLRSGR